jgi:hypothetical protein
MVIRHLPRFAEHMVFLKIAAEFINNGFRHHYDTDHWYRMESTKGMKE